MSGFQGTHGRKEGNEQEFQLETRHLVLMVALVVVLCVASFMLGRWVERQSLGPAPGGVLPAGRLADANIDDAGDVGRELTFFDTLKNQKQAPLEAPRTTPPAAATAAPRPNRASPAPSRPAPSTASAGSSRRSVNEGVMVQVFASGDRAAADGIRRRLREKGYTALLVSERGSWKVRVGPYADREEAERAAAVLREQERLTTWIP